MVQITYQKSDGTIFKRQNKSEWVHDIGESTSMGWKVLEIEYEYNNKFYPKAEYEAIMHRKRRAYYKKKQAIEYGKKWGKSFITYFLAVATIKLLNILFGI